jgi:hypothetical protein
MAAALDDKAEHCSGLDRTSYRTMAETWRLIARQAGWQDTPAAAALLA